MNLLMQRLPWRWLVQCAPVLLVPALLLITQVTSGAELGSSEVRPKTVAITTSLVTPFFNAYYLEGKFRASNHFALVVNASYLRLDNQDWKTKTGTVGAGVSYFFGGNALRRWYVEGIGEAWFSSWRYEPSGGLAPVKIGYAGLALAGYEFVFDAGPVLDLGAGLVVFHTPSAKVEFDGGTVTSKALTRAYPAAKLDVGWAF